MSAPDTSLGGNERAAAEKFAWAIAHCIEGCTGMNYGEVMQAVRRGVEAATEIGMHRSDPRWTRIAMALEQIRTQLAKTTGVGFLIVSSELAATFEKVRETSLVIQHRREN